MNCFKNLVTDVEKPHFCDFYSSVVFKEYSRITFYKISSLQFSVTFLQVSVVSMCSKVAVLRTEFLPFSESFSLGMRSQRMW